ncbi:hypothetical protein [Blastococcus sp. TF02A-30]|uniref:hypothetical protein n=1 Tax=Blastococcus sp. TF02A-30 TaxID=2250580 RepID=UPI000DE96626|nr:hypothetical protein [Blastococcus sp. TF02A-30]RBY92958.1 hypothetical protein DQ241_02720 [Blastococcus sp. TF02A-30]
MRVPSSSDVVLEDVGRVGWWLVVGETDGPRQVVAGPFPDRAEAGFAAATVLTEAACPAYGIRREDGSLGRRPSPQEWAWLAHLGEQLERLPDEWSDILSDEDPLTTLVVEVTAALSEAGLPLHDAAGEAAELGGACLTPQPGLGGIVVAWRQHDRMSVERVHGGGADVAVQAVMNLALAHVLIARGFDVEPLGDAAGHVVRGAAPAAG